jgi:glycosyltransferase involved in cell wall biosynthesis
LKIIVAQKGAREHYAVAQALHQRGMLAGLITDWYAFEHDKKRKAFQLFGGLGQSALAARCETIPDELVHSFPFRTLFWKWRVRRLAAQGRLYEAYAKTDEAFASAVARLKLPPHDVFFGYSYASLEMLRAEKQRGMLTVLDQIDPGAVEFRIVADEMKQHPEIAGPPPEFPTNNFDRNRREWELADIIIVNSEWSRKAIVAEGADPKTIEVLPLAYEVDAGNRKSEIGNRKSEGPLRVLWLGQVNVRKGIHYLMAAARLLEGENVRFDVVGPLGILPEAAASAPRNLTFHGPVSRDRAAEWYRQSDVFVLPTLSDGFALTQLEALAHGLPVIATPNCGSVVEHGKTGFIVPSRDAGALADAIRKFAADRTLSASMAPACLAAVNAYSVETYGKRLVEMIRTQL